MRRQTFTAALLVAACTTLVARGALAFSQNAFSGVGSPPGHDYLTAMAGLEVLGATGPAPGRKLIAKNLTVPLALVESLRKQTRSDANFGYALYEPVIAAIYGNRWVDLGGTTIADPCFDGIAQEPDSVQHDHFLRGLYESGLEGGKKAIADSTARFKAYFVKAATARPGKMWFLDGGIYQSAPQQADRRFFLLGRALHLLQDSFSNEHAIRGSNKPDTVIGIKTYVCTLHSQTHTFSKPLTPSVAAGAQDGDVIWKTLVGFDRRKKGSETNVHPEALNAIEASKDVFAAFIRVLGKSDDGQRAAAARAEAEVLAASWFKIDEQAMAIRLNSMSMNKDYIHDNKEQLACQGGHADFMDLATEAQRKCAYNLKAGYGYVSHGDWLDPAKVEFDDALGIPYAWKSSMLTRDEPPTSFVFRGRTASQAVLASAEVVVVQADAAIYAEPAVKANGAPLKKGTTVKVHLGRKNLGKDQTYEWCEAQVGNEAKHHWVPCKALPAHVRVAKPHPSRTIAAKGQKPKPKKPRGN